MNDIKPYLYRETLDLIKIFQSKVEPESGLAFMTLIVRFRQDVLQKCEINCRNFGHEPSVAEIMADQTFTNFGKKGKFISGNIKARNVDEELLFYLYRIARNELINYHRKKQKELKGKSYNGDEKIITELPDIDVTKLDKEAQIRYEIIKELPYAHRTIYLTYTAHEIAGINISKKLREQLQTHLNIKQSTIRTYKKEVLDKIKAGLMGFELSKN